LSAVEFAKGSDVNAGVLSSSIFFGVSSPEAGAGGGMLAVWISSRWALEGETHGIRRRTSLDKKEGLEAFFELDDFGLPVPLDAGRERMVVEASARVRGSECVLRVEDKEEFSGLPLSLS
jgi:hypothetical protein